MIKITDKKGDVTYLNKDMICIAHDVSELKVTRIRCDGETFDFCMPIEDFMKQARLIPENGLCIKGPKIGEYILSDEDIQVVPIPDSNSECYEYVKYFETDGSYYWI